MEFTFLKSWIWWVVLILELIPAYLWQVRSNLVTESKNLRWLHRSLDKFIFGPRLALIYRHATLISCAILIAIIFLLGWLAAVVNFLAYILLTLCIVPITKRHAQEVLNQLADHAQLQEYLATGIVEE